jgi:hypothetical protein
MLHFPNGRVHANKVGDSSSRIEVLLHRGKCVEILSDVSHDGSLVRANNVANVLDIQESLRKVGLTCSVLLSVLRPTGIPNCCSAVSKARIVFPLPSLCTKINDSGIRIV